LVGDGQFPGKGKLANRCLAVFAQCNGRKLHCFDTLPTVTSHVTSLTVPQSCAARLKLHFVLVPSN
jgi:hypothetical protein